MARRTLGVNLVLSIAALTVSVAVLGAPRPVSKDIQLCVNAALANGKSATKKLYLKYRGTQTAPGIVNAEVKKLIRAQASVLTRLRTTTSSLRSCPVARSSRRSQCITKSLAKGLPDTDKLYRRYRNTTSSPAVVSAKVQNLYQAAQRKKEQLGAVSADLLSCARNKRIIPPPTPTPMPTQAPTQTPIPAATPYSTPTVTPTATIDPRLIQDQTTFSQLSEVYDVTPWVVQPIYLGLRTSPSTFKNWLFSITSLPTKGKISGEPPYLRYVPNPNSSGVDLMRVSATSPNGFHFEKNIQIQINSSAPATSSLFPIGTYTIGKLHLYLERPAGASSCDLWLGFRRNAASRYMNFLVQAFDPDDHQKSLTFGEIPAGTTLPTGVESWVRVKDFIKNAGFHTARIYSGDTNDYPGTVQVYSNCGFTDFGFSQAHEKTWLSTGEYYFFAPPNIPDMKLTVDPAPALQLYNSNNQLLQPTSTSGITTLQTLTYSVASLLAHQWNDSLAPSRTYKLKASAAIAVQADNFPLIFTRTAALAQRLKASMQLHDGKLFNHKFQVEMNKKIRELLTSLQPPSEWVPSFESFFRAVPVNQFNPKLHMLYGRGWNTHQGSIEAALRVIYTQDTNPNNFWAGSPAYHPRNTQFNLNTLATRWDQYWINERPWQNGKKYEMGLMPRHWIAPIEAAALVAFDHQTNPLRGSEELIKRLIAGSFFAYQTPMNSEFGGWGPGYAGGQYFSMSNYGGVFHHLAPLIDPELVKLWAEAHRNLFYYHYTYSPGLGANNQYFYYFTPYLQFAYSSPDPYDQIYAEHRIDQTIRYQTATGYWREAYGNDGHYGDTSCFFMANIFRFTKERSADLLESVDRCMQVQNINWAFEPDGTRLGSSASFHRTTWPNPVARAARYVDHLLSGASLHTQSEPDWHQQTITSNYKNDDWGRANDLRKQELQSADRPDLLDVNIEYYLNVGGGREAFEALSTLPKGGAVHPAAETQPYHIETGDEFFSIKRDYFATVFYGKPGLSSNRLNQRSYFHLLPPPNNEENLGDDFKYDSLVINGGGKKELPFPYNGGGLSLLHHKDSGTQILSMNWGPTTQHGVVLITPDGKRLTTSYDSPVATFTDGAVPQLCVQSTLISPTNESNPASIRVNRCNHFKQNAVDVRVSVTNITAQPIQMQRLLEVIPIPVKTSRGVATIRAGGLSFVQRPSEPAAAGYDTAFQILWPPGGRRVSTGDIVVQTGSERPMTIYLDKVRTVDLQMNGLQIKGSAPRIGRIMVELTTAQNLDPGQTVYMPYTIAP